MDRDTFRPTPPFLILLRDTFIFTSAVVLPLGILFFYPVLSLFSLLPSSLRVLIPLLLVTLLFIGIFFLIFTIQLILHLKRRERTVYSLEDEGIRITRDFISVEKRVIPYKKITNVRLSQNPLQRMFSVGTLFIETAGSSGVEGILEDIPNPRAVMSHIEERIPHQRG